MRFVKAFAATLITLIVLGVATAMLIAAFRQ
jgi:hypothetical protein